MSRYHFIHRILSLVLFILLFSTFQSCAEKPLNYSVKDGQIVKGDTPVYFIGTNMWYAADLYLSDYKRFTAELDTLHSLGIDNLRILATGDDAATMKKVLKELDKRGMCAVLYLNNAWEWSPQCYRWYLEKAGEGVQPLPNVEGYEAYVDAMKEFAANEKAMALFHDHVGKMVSALKDAPAIFSWQICNEPRPFSEEPDKVEAFYQYIKSTAELIKSIDPNHLVSTGSEGIIGCNGEDYELTARIHQIPEIDYLTIHIWPYNWAWVGREEVESGVEEAIYQSGEYIDLHISMAQGLGKPMVIEEFGYPRDGFEFANTSSTTARDRYYKYIFGRVTESAGSNGVIAGCNFWAWNGFARQNPDSQFWQPGDDLCGDPSHEAQGLYGVYITDESTIEVIKRSVVEIEK